MDAARDRRSTAGRIKDAIEDFCKVYGKTRAWLATELRFGNVENLDQRTGKRRTKWKADEIDKLAEVMGLDVSELLAPRVYRHLFMRMQKIVRDNKADKLEVAISVVEKMEAETKRPSAPRSREDPAQDSGGAKGRPKRRGKGGR